MDVVVELFGFYCFVFEVVLIYLELFDVECIVCILVECFLGFCLIMDIMLMSVVEC